SAPRRTAGWFHPSRTSICHDASQLPPSKRSEDLRSPQAARVDRARPLTNGSTSVMSTPRVRAPALEILELNVRLGSARGNGVDVNVTGREVMLAEGCGEYLVAEPALDVVRRPH